MIDSSELADFQAGLRMLLLDPRDFLVEAEEDFPSTFLPAKVNGRVTIRSRLTGRCRQYRGGWKTHWVVDALTDVLRDSSEHRTEEVEDSVHGLV